MTTPNRKIKAKPFVRDFRDGMGDGELMEKYLLSPDQLQKVFQRLVGAGAMDEMELFMRTSLSDSTITKAFVETEEQFRHWTARKQLHLPETWRPHLRSKLQKRSTLSARSFAASFPNLQVLARERP